MRRAKALLLALVLVLIPLLTGCEYRELDNLVLIAGMGIDRDEDGMYRVSVETITMSKGGEKGEYTPVLVEATGHTILDATANMISITSGELQFSHCQTILIHEDLAHESIEKLIDFLYMNVDFDASTFVAVARGLPAGELLAVEPLTQRSQAFEIAETLANADHLEKSFQVSLQDLFSALHDVGRAVALPTLYATTVVGKKTVATEGAALFRHGQLVSFLSGEQTRFYLYAIDRIANGEITLPRRNGDWFSGRVDQSKTRLTPAMMGGVPGFVLEVDVTMSFASYHPDDTQLETLSADIEAYLKSGIEGVLSMAQSGVNVDLIGFGALLWRRHADWYFALADPASAFQNAPFEVRVNADVLGEGRYHKGDT